jgi:hypothetical protein
VSSRGAGVNVECLKSWIISGVMAGVQLFEFEGTENLEAGDSFVSN